MIDLPKVIAHRGASGHAPENTLASFYRAHELGATWVEFDVMRARCGELVVFHDETLDRTTDASGWLSSRTYAELAQLDAGSWFSPKYQDERISTLKEVIICLADCGLGANIEMKPASGQEKMLAKAVIETIKQCWPMHLPAPLISCANLISLSAAAQLDASLFYGLLLRRWDKNWLSQAKKCHCISIHINSEALTAQRVAEVKSHGYRVLAYTINQPKLASQLYDWGVDAIFSDYPEIFKAGSVT